MICKSYIFGHTSHIFCSQERKKKKKYSIHSRGMLPCELFSTQTSHFFFLFLTHMLHMIFAHSLSLELRCILLLSLAPNEGEHSEEVEEAKLFFSLFWLSKYIHMTPDCNAFRCALYFYFIFFNFSCLIYPQLILLGRSQRVILD